jgi:hypothetical protein
VIQQKEDNLILGEIQALFIVANELEGELRKIMATKKGNKMAVFEEFYKTFYVLVGNTCSDDKIVEYKSNGRNIVDKLEEWFEKVRYNKGDGVIDEGCKLFKEYKRVLFKEGILSLRR